MARKQKRKGRVRRRHRTVHYIHAGAAPQKRRREARPVCGTYTQAVSPSRSGRSEEGEREREGEGD